MTTYYYPSSYGSAKLAPLASAAGIRNFTGQYQAPAGSYTVVTPIPGTSPQKYTVTVDYTGPGTGYTGVATQTRFSDTDHLQAFAKIPNYGSGYLVLANKPVPAKFHYVFPKKAVPFQFTAGSTTDPTVPPNSTVQPADCFAAGTMIRTRAGEKAVEHLLVGDLVETVGGALRAVIWLGRRSITCGAHPQPRDLQPIRISAHAFGDNHPARDLFLSPGHPVLVGADEDGSGGHLVPIMCFVNGITIERVAVDEITYWHVELDAHDVLFAEGLPAESYIDLGSRPWFAGAAGELYDPDMALPGLPGRCRPVAIDGSVVEIERRRLDLVFSTRLAAACAWPTGDAPAFGWGINGCHP